MKSTRYILPVSAIALAAALVMLVLKVRATPIADVDDKKLARAEAAYKRRATNETVSATKSVRAKPRTEPVRATPRVNTAPPPPRTPEDVGTTFRNERPTPTLNIETSPKKELQAKMKAANKAYDKGDYPTAEDAALEILKDSPRNIRMLRIVVSTSCIMGNAEQANSYIAKLPARDQTQLRTRCSNWGLELPDEE